MRLRILISSSDSRETHVLLSGEVDLATVQDFRATLEGVAQGTADRIVLDMSELSYLGSVGVGAIIKTLDQLEAQGRGLVITGAEGPVKVVLQMLGLTYLVRPRASPHVRSMSVNGNVDRKQG